MKVTDFIFTPADALRGLWGLSWRHYVGFGLAIGAYIGLNLFIGSDVAFLIAGIIGITISGASYRLPLFMAIIGLLALMALSPFVHDGNTLDGFSEQIAVGVFFMLIFGVYKMVLDEVVGAFRPKKSAVPARQSFNNKPIQKAQNNRPRRPIPTIPSTPPRQPTTRPKPQLLDLTNARPIPLKKPAVQVPIKRAVRHKIPKPPQGLIQG